MTQSLPFRRDCERHYSSTSGHSNGENVWPTSANQLAVLGIRISAQCTVEEMQHPLSRETPLAGSSSSPNPSGESSSSAGPMSAYGGSVPESHLAATLQNHNYGPPSSFKNPDLRGSGGDTSRRRPRSADFSAKAKEAMMGFGRAARELPRGLYGLRNSSKTDVTDGRSGFAASTSSDRITLCAPQSCQPEVHSAPVRSILRVRRVYRLRLRSTAPDGHHLLPADCHQPVLVGCRTEWRSANSDGDDTGWERLRGIPIEYVGDTEPHESETGIGRAGVFHAFAGNADDDQQSDVDTSQDTAYSSNNMFTGNDDKRNQALLKVASPVDTFIEKAGQNRLLDGWRNEVVIRIRLSGGADSAAAGVSGGTEVPGSPLTPRALPAGSRGPRSSGDANHFGFPTDQLNDGEIIFLSCNSQKKLLDAIESTQLEHGRLAGALATQASAKLEGIEMINIAHTSSLNSSPSTDFDWTWQDDSVSGRTRPAATSRYVKCACALATVDSLSGQIRMLMSFQFVVDLAAMRMHLDDESSAMAGKIDHVSAGNQPQRRVSRSKKVLFSAQSDTTGLGMQCLEAQEQQRSSSIAPRSEAVRDDFSKKMPVHTPTTDCSRLKGINHVEMGLQDVASDSPIFRAAVQGLERRTTNLKRAAKAAVKSADDLVSAFDALEGLDVQVDHTLDDLSAFMPASMQVLSSSVLKKAREEEREHRQQTKAHWVTHVIIPVRALTDVCREVLAQLKTFEAESKAYYSATQKWLSSGARGSGTGESCNVSANGTDAYSPDAFRYDRSNAKAHKMDDEQRLRQARFDLARFDVYRAVCQLHAGEVELAIASHLMAISRWYCKGDENAVADLIAFESIANAEMERIKLDAQIAESRCQDLRNTFAEHLLESHSFQAGHDDDTEHDQLPLNGKMTGQKLKNFLSVIGGRVAPHSIGAPSPHKIGRASFSCTIPPVESLEARQTADEVAVGDSGGNACLLSASGNPQARPRAVYFNKQAVNSEHQRSRAVTSDIVHDASFDADRRIGSDAGAESMLTRSTSVSAATRASPLKQSQPLDTAAYRREQASDAYCRFRGNDMTIVPPDENSLRPMPIPLQAPREKDPPTRKKEGILWVMAKPISVTGTSDVPKAAVRSNNWRECWVVLSGSGHLGEYARWKDHRAIALEPAQPLIDLRFATVREARGLERRFSFEVVTRESRRFFQASNEEEYRGWMTAISFAIASLLDGTSSVRQVEKVVRHSVAAYGAQDGGRSPDREFGMRRVFDTDATPAGIGMHNAFSQSLTDLSAGAGARLLQRVKVAAGRDEGNGIRKRDSKTTNVPRGHLLALSEGNGSLDYVTARVKGDSDEEDGVDGDEARASPLINKHGRGISNTTPLSGYLAGARRKDADVEATAMILSSSTPGCISAPRSSLDIDTEYDRRIEALVNSNYGSVLMSTLSSSSGGVHSRKCSAHRTSLDAQRSTSSSRVSSDHISVHDGGQIKELSSFKTANAGEIMLIASRPENRECADCRAPDPRWASWYLNGEACCAFICITCSGIHRGMGVGVSKVRSVDLDEWTEEQLQAARRWGNTRVNAVYEAKKPREQTVASMGETRSKAFWTAKYVERAWFERSNLPQEQQDRNSSSAISAEDEFDVGAGGTAKKQTSSTHRPHRLDLKHTNIPTSPRAVSEPFAVPLPRFYPCNRRPASAHVPILKLTSGSASPH